MGRKNRQAAAIAARRARPEEIINVGETIKPWASVFSYGILPTAIPHTTLFLCYILSVDNSLCGDIFPVLLRLAPTAFLLWRLHQLGRDDWYRYFVGFGHFVAMGGDVLMMRGDELNCLRAMACYAMMHAVVTLGLGYAHFATSNLVAAVSTASMFILLLLPFLQGYLLWFVPIHASLVCVAIWRVFSRFGPDEDWTELCGAIGTLLYLVSNINFSMNLYGGTDFFDPLQILTLSLYSVGQQLMTISALDCKECMKAELMDREAARDSL